MPDTDFTVYNKQQLSYLADKTEALVKGTDKTAFSDALNVRGLTPDRAKELLKQREEEITASHPNHKEPVIQKDDDTLLIHMRRANPTYEWRRYRFTTEHPFVLMEVADANDLLRFETGFLIATPEEAKEFYGRS